MARTLPSTFANRQGRAAEEQHAAWRALKDGHKNLRSAALQALAEKWPDDQTRQLLHKYSRSSRFAATEIGKQHSRFGFLVFTRDIDGIAPYLDPREPIPQEHIDRAAMMSNVPLNKVNEMVQSLSEYLGWDINKGSTDS